MSRATKRKHVLNEVLQDDYSNPTEDQQIVRVLSSKGNNLHEVQTVDNTTFLVSMPNKFRKNLWIKRGDFVLVESIKEGDKVKAEIVRILTKDHIKYYKQDNVWPKEFDSSEKSSENQDNELICNMNRPQVESSTEEDSDSNDDDSDSSE